MWNDQSENNREAETQVAAVQTEPDDVQLELDRRDERFATTELRAITDVVRSVGYPAGSPYSRHVTFLGPGQGGADSPYVMPTVSIPEGDPPSTNPTFLHEKATLEAEMGRLIARVRDVKTPSQNKSRAEQQGGGQGNNTAVASTSAAAGPAAPAAPTGPTFPRFNDLPYELRDQIWEWALRAECRGRVVLVDVFTQRVLPTKGLVPQVGRACWESRTAAAKFHFVQLPVYRVTGRGWLDMERLRAGIRRPFVSDEDDHRLLKFGNRIREEKHDCGVVVKIGPSGSISLNSCWDTFIWGPRWERCKSQEKAERKRECNGGLTGSGSSDQSGGGDNSNSNNIGAEQEREPAYFRYATVQINHGHLGHTVFNMTPPENVFGITNIGRTPRHPRLAFARSVITSAMHPSLFATTGVSPPSVAKTPYNTPRTSSSSASGPPVPPQLNRVTHMSYPPEPSFTLLTAQDDLQARREPSELRAARSLFGPNRVDHCFRIDLAGGRGADNREVLRALVGTEKDGDGASRSPRAVEGRDRAIARLGRLCYHVPGVTTVGKGWALEPPIDARLVRTSQDLGI